MHARDPSGAAEDALAAPSWHDGPREPVLAPDEVHVWKVPLDLDTSPVQRLREVLSPDELVRADRFRFARDRNHFIAARGALRSILGCTVGMPAERLRFRYSTHGKPELAAEDAGGEIRFSLSHSHGLALLGVARGRDIGVDLEQIRPEVAGEHIAERFFSPREVEALGALPAHRRAEAFFRCWTRKEAFIKAKGGGLSILLAEFDVSVAPGEPAALLSTRWDAEEAARWSLADLAVGHEYAAAVAAQGHGWLLRCWQWSWQGGG